MKAAAAMFLILVVMTSCSVEDEAYTHSRVAVIERPDVTFTDAVHTFAQQGRDPLTVHSRSLSYWMDEGRMEAEGLSFSQMDEDGELVVEGRADRALIDTSGEVMDLTGNVEMRYVDRDLSISCHHLIFDTMAMTVECDSAVDLSFDDGTMTGESLSGDLRSMRIEIGRSVQGVVGI